MNRKRQASRKKREAPFQKRHEEEHAEQAVHDGGNAREGLGGNAHHFDELIASRGVLHEKYRRHDAKGHGDDQRQENG